MNPIKLGFARGLKSRLGKIEAPKASSLRAFVSGKPETSFIAVSLFETAAGDVKVSKILPCIEVSGRYPEGHIASLEEVESGAVKAVNPDHIEYAKRNPSLLSYRVRLGDRAGDVPSAFYEKGMGGIIVILNSTNLLTSFGADLLKSIARRIEGTSADLPIKWVMDDVRTVPLSRYLDYVSALEDFLSGVVEQQVTGISESAKR